METCMTDEYTYEDFVAAMKTVRSALLHADEVLGRMKNFQRMSVSANEEIGVPLGEWYEKFVHDLTVAEAELEPFAEAVKQIKVSEKYFDASSGESVF